MEIEIKKGIDIHFKIKNTMDYDKSQKLQQIRYVTVDDLMKWINERPLCNVRQHLKSQLTEKVIK